MDEAKASWNTVYMSKDGFECQVTLRDDDEEALAKRVATITKRILESGGTPVSRRYRNGSREMANGSSSDSSEEKRQEKTYIDQKGVRRCNLALKSGKRCGQPVTEKEGRYGIFWSCPSYKEHAQRNSK